VHEYTEKAEKSLTNLMNTLQIDLDGDAKDAKNSMVKSVKVPRVYKNTQLGSTPMNSISAGIQNSRREDPLLSQCAPQGQLRGLDQPLESEKGLLSYLNLEENGKSNSSATSLNNDESTEVEKWDIEGEDCSDLEEDQGHNKIQRTALGTEQGASNRGKVEYLETIEDTFKQKSIGLDIIQSGRNNLSGHHLSDIRSDISPWKEARGSMSRAQKKKHETSSGVRRDALHSAQRTGIELINMSTAMQKRSRDMMAKNKLGHFTSDEPLRPEIKPYMEVKFDLQERCPDDFGNIMNEINITKMQLMCSNEECSSTMSLKEEAEKQVEMAVLIEKLASAAINGNLG